MSNSYALVWRKTCFCFIWHTFFLKRQKNWSQWKRALMQCFSNLETLRCVGFNPENSSSSKIDKLYLDLTWLLLLPPPFSLISYFLNFEKAAIEKTEKKTNVIVTFFLGDIEIEMHKFRHNNNFERMPNHILNIPSGHSGLEKLNSKYCLIYSRACVHLWIFANGRMIIVSLSSFHSYKQNFNFILPSIPLSSILFITYFHQIHGKQPEFEDMNLCGENVWIKAWPACWVVGFLQSLCSQMARFRRQKRQ